MQGNKVPLMEGIHMLQDAGRRWQIESLALSRRGVRPDHHTRVIKHCTYGKLNPSYMIHYRSFHTVPSGFPHSEINVASL
jgi:hypothetical protein